MLDNLKEEFGRHNIYINDELRKSIQNYYHIRLTYTSNYIEGTNYTEEETKKLIVSGQKTSNRTSFEACAVLGHDKAFLHMISLQNKGIIDESDVLKFHESLGHGLENNAVAEQYRNINVRVGSYLFLPHERVRHAMKQMFENLKIA
jgi:Fic family protein